MNKLNRLAGLGQSIWLDYIQRSLIKSGDLYSWIERGLRGVTSNPSIFEKAIAGSDDYDEQLRALVAQGKTIQQIYEALVLPDIAQAADLLRPVYDATDGLDGYVSLEADPSLAHDTAATVAEIEHFHRVLDRPNVMFKVPATPAGVPAIQRLIASGINVNVTLIFSLAHYGAIVEAYLAGLEKLIAAGGDPKRVASVASFFVSRVDTAVDPLLEKVGATDLLGQIAVANAKVAYARTQEIYRGPRWQALADKGARVQRLLWGSTSTKNPAYSDVKYVEELIGRQTVNTVPPDTLRAFVDHGQVALTLERDLAKARTQLARLQELGIDLDEITQQLQDKGVEAFRESFESLLLSISEKQERLLGEWEQMSLDLGAYQERVSAALDKVAQENVLARIWNHDHTLWKPDPDEITNRLGWLDIAAREQENIDCLEALADDVRAEGYTQALLLGMGGSSLAPEMFARIFGTHPGYLKLQVLDSTSPGAVMNHASRLDPARTLFIVSTKSGTTTETLSLFKFFYNRTADALGEDVAGAHFVAVTDPGSKLVAWAKDENLRTTFLNDPNIGGRYSALSYFGLVPAALLGIDLEQLLDRAVTVGCSLTSADCAVEATAAAATLGVTMSELAAAGRDKLTLITSPSLASFGDWVEQLVAESTGKEGKGILPVVGEPVGEPEVYGSDRLFVYLRLDGEGDRDRAVEALAKAGHPVVRMQLRDVYDVGQQIYLWELATAIAGQRMGINPFDQPNVESAKRAARRMIEVYKETGRLPEGETAPFDREALHAFLKQAQPGDYIALQAYVEPTQEVDRALQHLRRQLRERYGLATTVGYGPRFLHSTGQLHKGDAGAGLFVQFTAAPEGKVPIPDETGDPHSSLTFGVLIAAQALGDQQALLEAGRRVIHFDLGEDVVAGLEKLMGPVVP